MMIDYCQKAFEKFDLGNADQIDVIPSGHIHSSFVVHSEGQRYLMQGLNEHVFRDIEAVMNNAERLLKHLDASISYPYQVASLYHADGDSLVRNEGGAWRCQKFIDGRDTSLGGALTNEAVAYSFGLFSRVASELQGEPLRDTLPNFHNPVFRMGNYLQAKESAGPNRSTTSSELIGRVSKFEYLADKILTFRSYTEIAHNDPKPSNILVDDHGDPIAIIDFDTVMTGSRYDDFGDLVRSLCGSEEENVNPDTSHVYFRKNIFEEIYGGFLNGREEPVTDESREKYFLAGAYIIFEQAIRFLTDFLDGDRYYKVDYPEHNLVRANNQVTLLESMGEL